MRGLMRRSVAGAAVVLRWRVIRLLAVAGLAAGALSCVPGLARAATGPAVTGVSPSSGPVAGGTTVTITGTGFTGATGVDFGSAAVPASSFTVNSAGTSITATAPDTAVAGPPVDVTVTTPAGTSATGPADQYTYLAEYSYPPAGASGGEYLGGPGVGAVDQNGTTIDIPLYMKPAAYYSLTSVDDGSGLNHLVGTQISNQPKQQRVFYASALLVGTFIGADTCGSEPWPMHTMSYPLDVNCWEETIDASTGPVPGNWYEWVPTTITDADGKTLVFDHWTGSPDTGHCDAGDMGYVQGWPGAGSYTPGVPGAFAAGEQFNAWSDGGGMTAHYALRSAGTTAPLIELDAPFDCQWYQQNQVVAPQFSCIDLDGSGVQSCTATGGVTADGKLDTSTPGAHTLTITATDNNGNTRTLTRRYEVGQPPTMTITADPSAPSATGWYNASQLGDSNTLPVNVTINPSPGTDSIDTASCTMDGSSTPIWSFDSEPPADPNKPAVVPLQFSSPGTQTLQVGQGRHTLSCTATDLSGQTTTQSASYKVDTNPPPQATFLNPSPPDQFLPYTCAAFNGNEIPATYEAGTQQSIQWWITGDDGADGSGIVSPTATTGDTTLPTSQLGSQAASAPDTVDAAGNVTAGQSCAYNVDDTIPPADTPAVTGTQGTNGWYTSDVAVNWNWTDAGGIAPNCTQTSTTSGEGSSLTVMASCTDLSGNQATDLRSFNVDKTPPAVSVTGVQDGARYIGGAVPAAGCSTTDATSGVAANASVSVTPAGSGVGSYSATCSGAVDKAGNTAAPVSVSYTVTYGFGGFIAPAPGSTAKDNPGAALPVKFTLTTSTGTPISATLAATLASKLTVTLAGQGITPVTAGCAWSPSASAFTCPAKIPALSKMGSSNPYTITAYESVPGGQVKIPSWTTTTADQNPETIYFK